MSLYGLQPQSPTPPGGLGSGLWRQPPFKATAKVAAGGTAQISMDSVPAGQLWVIERINISSTSAAQSVLRMYDGANIASATFLDGSATGNLDIDDAAVLVLFPNDQLTLAWSGATPGATCACRIQYHTEATP